MLIDKSIKGQRFMATPATFSPERLPNSTQRSGDLWFLRRFPAHVNFRSHQEILRSKQNRADRSLRGRSVRCIGTCSAGSTLEKADSKLQNTGFCTEACWPYNGSKQACAATKSFKILAATGSHPMLLLKLL